MTSSRPEGVRETKDALEKAQQNLNSIAHATDQSGRSAQLAQQALRLAEKERLASRAAREQAEESFGEHFPGESWWRDRDHREASALWTDPVWNQSPTELFLAALRLHKAFLMHTPRQLRQSLHGVADIIGGEAPADLSGEAALAAWQALFFVVPVVSTTFASYARMFSHLKAEALSWLLVDEAGQATPQQAVGAMWRSKRAVVVGDPLQLEPIVTMPFRAEQAIRQSFGVAEQWLASGTSVQRLADRVTSFGTKLPGETADIWVGTPLSVHRRCDQSMFGIANHVAYNDTMINRTAAEKAAEFAQRLPALPESKWIDVVSSAAAGHWIPEEGVILTGVLSQLAAMHVDLKKVMIVTPFRDVARRIKGYEKTYPGLVAGTIHTAQGKEADIVILVLGGNPQSPGARRWVAGKPNLLNVAVSRAKRRLYVIGNHQNWAGQRHFDVLAARLPRYVPHNRSRS